MGKKEREKLGGKIMLRRNKSWFLEIFFLNIFMNIFVFRWDESIIGYSCIV